MAFWRNDEDLTSDDEQESMNSEQESEDQELDSTFRHQAKIKLITEESLLPAQREDLLNVMDLLAIKEQVARTLSIYYRWDFERLFEAFNEKGPEWLFSQAGVAIRPQSTNSVVTVCTICGEDGLKEEDTTTMDCGHTFCNFCWTRHFLTQISEGQSKRIECMAVDCNVICCEDIIRKLVAVEYPEAAERFDRFLFQSYIDDNEKVKWCPSVPHCGNAVRVEEDVHCEIQCSCGHQFCFNCLAQPHSPCSCSIWKLWHKKCQDQSETLNWIVVNTKPCPKCGKNVIKDVGCNLVTCLCDQHFCWLCGAATGALHDWERIEGHTCGRYKEDRETETDIVKAERDLKRYTHYFSRWEAHQDSLKLEAKQSEELAEKIENLDSKESGVPHYRWLRNALRRLFRARRALAYSYAFAFHMFGNDILSDVTPTKKKLKQGLFEDQQQQLEGTVEKLSKLIEGSFDEDSFQHNRKLIIGLSAVVDTSCKNMYEFIQKDLVREHRLIKSHSIAPYNSEGVHILSDK